MPGVKIKNKKSLKRFYVPNDKAYFRVSILKNENKQQHIFLLFLLYKGEGFMLVVLNDNNKARLNVRAFFLN